MGITVASSILGTSSVGRGSATIALHLAEVESSVHAAANLGKLNVEGELLSEQLEDLVLGASRVEKVDTRTGVSGGSESDGQGVSGGGNTRAGVVDTLNSAVGSASHGIGTDGAVPGTRVGLAVGVAANLSN